MGAFLNVKINAAGLNDKAYVASVLAEGSDIERNAKQMEEQILEIVNQKINA
jgi:glutamate formiminotransferase/formiminotetrahydrofolate cyclodeaminase